ncbi:beta-lactamase family protein [Erwiniaceae bacterium BAC15a-03b]|uniref:Beta-lactamase family protein n=1 Tax=Winslowiella arboricola TaxID=2978220 RepID=A0A9J6PR99_9GAMM|nr:serine hydrolase [Winslowiella arboricola]MCU5771440.1 beta-lactamase family protein [Winslowiella arboricola]MCU5778189.1 beta-lactamase family protein [Winslowiella arboricola]
MFIKLRRYLETINTDAMMVLQHGECQFAVGDLSHRFQCHSMRKSFLSALYGPAVAEDRIDLSLTLQALGIDDREGLSAVEKQACLYDLLTARSGIYHPANYETAWMKRIKPARHRHAPGENWCYSNWDFNALGTAWLQLTGEDIHQAFDQRIARPVGMEDFRVEQDGWMEPGESSQHAAYPFRLSTRDLARFGQLFLQQGQWQGESIIPAAWVNTSTAPISHAGDRGAYGYMWWVTRDSVAWPEAILPAGSYSARGAGGHFCLVLPTLDMVVVHRVDTDQPGREVNRFQIGKLLQLLLDECDNGGVV